MELNIKGKFLKTPKAINRIYHVRVNNSSVVDGLGARL